MTGAARRLLLALVLLVGTGAAAAGPSALDQAPASFRSWLESLPEAQQQAARRRLDEMPERRRTRLFQRWDTLDEGRRHALEQRMAERLEHGVQMQQRPPPLPPESQEKLAPLVRRWRDMGPEGRRRMRQRLERFGTLSPDAQQALIDRRFADRPPEERARILESLREASKALPQHPLLDAPEGPPEPPGRPPAPAPEPTPPD
jgi:hypothetical protein